MRHVHPYRHQATKHNRETKLFHVLRVNGQDIKQVASFRYLGSLTTEGAEIKRRIALAKI